MATSGNPLASLIVKFVAEAQPFISGIQDAQSSVQGFSDKLTAVGKTLATTLPFAGVGIAAFHAAEQFDEASATIARTTGATGQRLADLESSFKSVFTQTSISAGDLADGFARIQRETGATGDALDKLVLTNANLAKVTGQQLTPVVEATQAALKQFGVTADQQPAKLDAMLALVQKTGISITTLSTGLQSAGPVLKGLGLSFEQSAALLANFEEHGISTDKVVAALNKGLVTLASEGIKNPEQEMRNFIDRLTQAKTPLEAVNIASETFGKRAGLFFADAARQGAFNIGELTKAAANSSGVINSTADNTKTLGDSMKELSHNVEVALEPLGKPLVQALDQAVKAAIPLLQTVGKISEAFADANPRLVALTASVIAAGPALILASKYFKELAAATAFLKIPQVLTFSVAGVPILPFAAAAAATAIQIDNLQRKWEDFDETLKTKQILDALNQGKTIEGLKQLGFSIDDIKKAVGGLDSTKQTFADMGLGIKVVTDEVSKLKTVAPPTAEEVKKAFSDLGLKDIAKGIADVQNAFSVIARSGKLSADQLRGAFETAQLKIIELRNSVASAPLKALGIDTTELDVARKALELITQDVLTGRASMDQLAQAQENYNQKVHQSEAGINRIEVALGKAGAAGQQINLDSLVQEITVAQNVVNGLSPAFHPVKEDVDAAAKLVDELAANLEKAGPSALPLREALREIQLQMSAIRNTTLFNNDDFDFTNAKLDQFVARLLEVQTTSLSVEATLHDLGERTPAEVADGIAQIQDAIEKMNAAAAVGIPGALQAVQELYRRLTAAQIQALDTKPFHEFGVTSQAELNILAAQAERDFNTIKSTVGVTARDIESSWLGMIEELKRRGAQFSAETESRFLDAQRRLANTAQAAVDTIDADVKSAVRDVSDSIAQSIVQANNWADAFTRVGQKIGEDIIAGVINHELQGTIKIIDDLIIKFGKWIGLISDAGTAAAQTAAQAAKIATPPFSTTSEIPGIGGGGGAGAGGAAVGAAVSGVTGVLTSVFTGISAITGILSLFGVGQGGQKDRLNSISDATQYVAWVFGAGGGHDALLNIQNGLNNLVDAFVNWFRDDVNQLIQLATDIKALQGGGAPSGGGPLQTFSGPVTFNISVSVDAAGSTDPVAIADAITRKIKLRSPVFA